MKKMCCIAAVMAAGMIVGQARADAPLAGYAPAQREQTVALPLYLVAAQETVRPQYAFMPMPVDQVVQNMTFSMPAVMTSGAGIVGGALGGALANAMMRAEAIAMARESWQWANQGQCRIDVRRALEPALLQALEQAGMPAPQQHIVLEDSDLDSHFDPAKAHHRITHSTSMTPGMTAMLTTVRLEGWSDQERSRQQADWVNVLQVLSTPMWLDAKQAHDTDYLKQQLDHWYAGTGNAARIAQVNAAGRNADPALRRQAVSLQRSYDIRLRRINRKDWTPYAAGMARALGWGSNDCALMERAVQENAREAGRLLVLAYAGQLPQEGVMEQAPVAGQEPGPVLTASVMYRADQPRHLLQLAPSVHLSQQAAGGIPVVHHHTVLDADELTP
jgi:hypothetical protein